MKRDDLTRNVFRDADTDLTPDVSRLLSRTDELMARAARGESTQKPDALIDLVPLAWTMIPRFALGAALLVVVSVGWSWVGETVVSTTDSTLQLESLILGGESSNSGSDLLLDAMVNQENSDG
jgi:hypothetical protein